MTTSYQSNALDISYNGWENYQTWNVALWINNEEGLYHLAMEAGDYETFVKEVGVGNATPDGVKFSDPRVNVVQLNSDVFDFWVTLTLRVGVIKYTLSYTQFTTFSFFIMSLSIALSLLAQANTGDEILTILDTIVSDVEQENINSCAEVFEVWM